jgi:hypothetical protein
MKKTAIVIVALFTAAASASAQDMYTNAKNKALGAAKAENAHIEAMQKPEAQAPAQKAQPTKPAPAPAQAGKQLKQGAIKPGTELNVPKADTAGPPPTIYREVFEYARDGRRDPFVSLLTTNELRPTMSDLRLTGILFDHSGRNSLATLRDITNNSQYRVTVGSALGRMRVAAIRTLTIVFTIDEFGTTRRDSLTLRDSTNRARIR